MVKSAAGLGGFRWRCGRRRRKQSINSLMSKSGYPVMHKITANHAFGEPLLILLVNHPAIGDKILLAAPKEFSQGDLLFGATAFCMADTNNSFGVRECDDAA